MLIAIGVVVLVVVLVGVALAVRRGAAGARARIDTAVGDLQVLRKEKANFYGVASKGTGQVRGIGTLVLTPDALVFLQMVPAVEVRVPRAAITHTEVAQSFLGKTQGRDLLVVEWTTDDDPPATDRVAFDLPDLASWRSALSD
jgi:hypothetical protein